MLFSIVREDIKRRVCEKVMELAIDEGWIVIIDKGQKGKSEAQRRLFHRDCAIIAKDKGHDPKELKKEVKRTLPFIYEQDEKRAKEFMYAIFKFLKTFYAGFGIEITPWKDIPTEHLSRLALLPIRMRSSQEFSMEEYSMLYDALIARAHQEGVTLPAKDYI